MPQLGETVTEGTITKWLKGVGDTIARDEPLFEVSTDKVDSEVPAPSSGTLAEIRVQEGDTVEVGAVLAVIADGASGQAQGAGSSPATAPGAGAPGAAGEDGEVTAAAADERAGARDQQAAAAAIPAPAVEPAPPPEAEAANGAGRAGAASSPSPSAPTAQSSSRPDGAGGPPSGPPAVTAAMPGSSGSTAEASAGSSLVLSPVVRRLLHENGIDPSEITGTGMGGRITRTDVLREIDTRRAGGGPAPAASRPTAPAAAPAAPAAPAAADRLAAPAGGGPAVADEVVPFTNIRRRTAEHMVRSKATSPHALVVAEADFEAVEQVRRRIGARFREEEGFSLTYLPFVARATVEALHEWDHLNASVGDDALVVHHRIHLGIAVDLAFEGLIAPVIHDADELTVRGIARRVHDLANRARTKKLGPDQLAGGTFTITNPGPFGTLMTFPVINQPQVGILSTDGVKRKPVVVTAADGTESIAIRSVGMISLAWDHRAVDGAYAAAFVRRVAELIATHDWSSEL